MRLVEGEAEDLRAEGEPRHPSRIRAIDVLLRDSMLWGCETLARTAVNQIGNVRWARRYLRCAVAGGRGAVREGWAGGGRDVDVGGPGTYSFPSFLASKGFYFA